MHPRDLRLLFHFAEIVRAGSIRGAARALGVSAPVVSTALNELEAIAGTTLIRRTTRKLVLTDTGREVHAHAEAMMAQAQQAMAAGEQDRAPSGTVRLASAIELCVSWLPPILAAFRKHYPDVRLMIDADDAPIDLTFSGVDLALRVTPFKSKAEADSIYPDALTTMPIDLVCSSHFGTLSGDLTNRLDQTGFISSFPDSISVVTACDAAGTNLQVDLAAGIRTNERLTAHAMTLAGCGAALLLRETVQPDIHSGRLMLVDEQLDFGVVAVRPILSDRHPSSAVRALTRFLKEWFQDGSGVQNPPNLA